MGTSKIGMAAAYLAAVAAVIVVLVPLLCIVNIAVSDWVMFNENFFSFLRTTRWSNFIGAWKTGHMGVYFVNTFIVMIISLGITNITASLCAFSAKYYRSREATFTYYLLLTGIFIPIQAVMLPLLMTLKNMGLMNSLFGLALIYSGMGLPLATMIFTGFYKGLPQELIEAATIDGSNSFRVYISIIMPLSKTIVTTVIILSGLTIWRDFFVPLVVITDPAKKTIATSMQLFTGQFTTDWSGACAAMVMQTIPIFLLFVFLQRYFIAGIVSGAVKG